MSRSRSTVKAVSNVGGAAYLSFVKFKIFYQHLASYPKVIYFPLLFMGCGVYGFHSVKKTSAPYTTPEITNSVENPFENFESFQRWVKEGISSLIGEIVGSKHLQKEGISYLERMFKNKSVHEAIVVLLKGGVKDSRFIADSKIFGIDWISKTITADKTKCALKHLVCEAFTKDSRVTQVAV